LEQREINEKTRNKNERTERFHVPLMSSLVEKSGRNKANNFLCYLLFLALKKTFLCLGPALTALLPIRLVSKTLSRTVTERPKFSVAPHMSASWLSGPVFLTYGSTKSVDFERSIFISVHDPWNVDNWIYGKALQSSLACCRPSLTCRGNKALTLVGSPPLSATYLKLTRLVECRESHGRLLNRIGLFLPAHHPACMVIFDANK